MHVLLIPSWYPRNPDDVNGVFFRDQALELSKMGIQVGVLAIYVNSLNLLSFKKSLFSIKKEDDSGIRTIRIETFNWVPRLASFSIFFWKFLVNIGYKKYLNFSIEKPNVIHAHSAIFGGIAAREIKEKFNIPYVVSEHKSSFNFKSYNRLLTEEAEQVFLNSSCSIAVGEMFLDQLASLFPQTKQKWIYIPNVLSSRFLNLKLQKKPKGKKFVIGSLSVLTENKGVLTLIKALPIIHTTFPDVVLKIGGDGPFLLRLKEEVKILNLQDQVEFLGKIQPKDTISFYKKIDIFALPSVYETFGVVIIEALANGIPVVATDCGGPSSIIKDRAIGSLIPVNDPVAFSKAVVEIMENYESFDPLYIQNYVLSKFSPQVVLGQVTNVYTQMTSNEEGSS